MADGTKQRRPIVFSASHTENGGVRLLWELFAQSFFQRGFEPHLLALYGDDRPATDAGWKTFSPSRSAAYKIPHLLATIAVDLARIKPAAVISAMPAANVLFPVAAAMAGIPNRIATHHSPADTHQPLFRTLDRIVGSTPVTTRIVCVSGAVRESLARYPSAYRRKTIVIHNALPPDVAAFLQPLTRLRAGIAQRPARLIAAGRLAGQKNYPTLIRAMAKVDGATLQIAGDGADRAPLQALAARLGVADRIAFLGHRDHRDVLRLMSEADIFVQPSLYEGHSIALLEALTLGMPVVASDIPTQREALTRADGTLCGELVPVLDADVLAARINTLLANPQRLGELSALAVSAVADSRYDKVVEAYANLIDRSA